MKYRYEGSDRPTTAREGSPRRTSIDEHRYGSEATTTARRQQSKTPALIFFPGGWLRTVDSLRVGKQEDVEIRVWVNQQQACSDVVSSNSSNNVDE